MQNQKKKIYPSDLSDTEWDIIFPLLPTPRNKLGKGGRPSADLREVVNAIFYLTKSGCQWRMLPKEFPPKSTVYEYFAQWKKDGTWQKVHDSLRDAIRKKAGKKKRTNTGNH